MNREYTAPHIHTEKSFEASALACGKTTDPPPGSYHFSDAYDTFSGHAGPGFGGSESVTGGNWGTGFGPGGTSQSYFYSGLCLNWITFSS